MGMDYEHLQRAILNERVQEAKTKGLAEGRAEEKRETAKRLFAKGMSIADIADVTGLTPDELQAP